MRSIFIILLLVVSWISEEIEGFRNYKWGDSSDKLGKVKGIDKNVNEKYFVCVKEKEQLMVGDVKLNDIQYVFFDNKLYAVYMPFSGQDNLLKIKKAFQSKYQAKWFQLNPYLEDYIYTDNNSAISIKCDSIYKKCYAYMSNKKLSNERDKYADNVAKKGAKDL